MAIIIFPELVVMISVPFMNVCPSLITVIMCGLRRTNFFFTLRRAISAGEVARHRAQATAAAGALLFRGHLNEVDHDALLVRRVIMELLIQKRVSAA